MYIYLYETNPSPLLCYHRHHVVPFTKQISSSSSILSIDFSLTHVSMKEVVSLENKSTATYVLFTSTNFSLWRVILEKKSFQMSGSIYEEAS